MSTPTPWAMIPFGDEHRPNECPKCGRPRDIYGHKPWDVRYEVWSHARVSIEYLALTCEGCGYVICQRVKSPSPEADL